MDPLRCKVEWKGSHFLDVATFRRLVTTTNSLVKRSPSIHQGLFGKEGGNDDDTLHMHNVFTKDDAWHVRLASQMRRWTEWGLSRGTQTQLVSFASTFNSGDVMGALESVTDASQLPIQCGKFLAEQQDDMRAFLGMLMQSGRMVFSIRFNGQLHNNCLDARSSKARNAAFGEVGRVLNFDEAESLTTLPTYTTKRSLLSRNRSFHKDPNRSF